jgi:hypothetical protein
LGDEAIARLVAQNASYGVDAIAAALIETVDRAADAMQDNTTVIVIAVDDGVTL